MARLDPRRSWRALNPTQRDLALGALVAVAMVAALRVEVSRWYELPGASPFLGYGLMAVSGGVLCLHRRRPLVAGILSAGAFSLASALEYYAFIPSLLSALVVGACAAHASRRATLLLGTVVVALAVALAIFESAAVYEGELEASELVSSIALAAVPVAIGDAFRVRRELAAEAVARASRLEQLRELELKRAVDEERLRIARDVHDTVGHHLSAIAIQSGAGEQLAEDGDDRGALRALETIRDLTGTALAETRRLLGLVRTEAERRAPGLPGVAEIEALAHRAGQGGLEVAVIRSGEERPLDGVIGDCAYRIVQEALTNVSRHAGAGRVIVELRYGAEALDLLIEDDGRGGAPAGDGHGLIGMRERVAMAGGTLTVGPLPAGGWRVEATLPYEPLPAR